MSPPQQIELAAVVSLVVRDQHSGNQPYLELLAEFLDVSILGLTKYGREVKSLHIYRGWTNSQNFIVKLDIPGNLCVNNTIACRSRSKLN